MPGRGVAARASASLRSAPGEGVKQIGAGDDADRPAVLHHRQTVDALATHQPR
jgi:hypothetical protein